MIELLRTTDPIKLTALQAALASGGVVATAFDAAAGSLWQAVIPVRLMVADGDANAARRVLREAGFREASDGDWDLAPVR
ncbi:MAG: DUF2007 domain-containing protein [Caulobacteraceae bacterium]